jgi:predicted O-methyltransferase YrrM
VSETLTEKNWAELDRTIASLFVNPDPALDAAMQASEKAGLPDIEVSPPYARLLFLLAKMVGARRILEIGTLGGYSTICMARALPRDGRLISLEYDPKHAEIARKNIDHAGLSGIAEVRVGRALDLLPKIAAAGEGPFDLVFIDADKPNNPAYFDWALKLSRKGTVIVADNVIRYPEVTGIPGAKTFLDVIAREERVSATAIQTVGMKGHDGFALAVVTAEI